MPTAPHPRHRDAASASMMEQARTGTRTRSLPLQSESAWRDRTVIPYARLKGWRVYFTHTSKFSPAGFPDLVLVRGPRLMMRELKTERGVVTGAQADWLERLYAAGVDASVWRPSDWPAIQKELE